MKRERPDDSAESTGPAPRTRNEISGWVAGNASQVGVVYGNVYMGFGSPQVEPRAWHPVGVPVREATDALDFGVRPAITAPATRRRSGHELTTYALRLHDKSLGEAVDRALGGRSTVAVLVGDSSTGKTRACWEALRRLPDEWRVWHPVDPQEILAAIDCKSIAPCTVIWLDDSHDYLAVSATNLARRVAIRLRRLLKDPEHRPVLLLGTLWKEQWSELEGRRAPQSGDGASRHDQACALLSGHTIRVPEQFESDEDMAELRSAALADPRLSLALEQAEQGQIIQYLADAAEIIKCYENADAAPRAVLDAAIDARRIGYRRPLPPALLRDAAPAYMTDRQWAPTSRRDWFGDALAFTAVSVRGAESALAARHPRPGHVPRSDDELHLADILEQHGSTARTYQMPPNDFWRALTTHADKRDLARLAEAAADRGLVRTAVEMYFAAHAAGDQGALTAAADLLQKCGRTTEIRLLRDASGDRTGDTFRQTMRMLDEGNRDEAFACLSRKAAGNSEIYWAMGYLLCEAGHLADAADWLFQYALVDDAEALDAAEHWGRKAGRLEDALEAARRGAANGRTTSMLHAGQLLLELDQPVEAFTFLRRAAALGQGDFTDTTSEALGLGVRWLTDQRGREAALSWLEACASGGIRDALFTAIFVYYDDGLLDEALACAERAATAGDRTAPYVIGEILKDLGHDREALEAYLRLGCTPYNIVEVADLLRKIDGEGAELAWLETQAATGSTVAIGRITSKLTEVGALEKAREWYWRAACCGDKDALFNTAFSLMISQQTAEAVQLNMFGWQPDGTTATPWGCIGPPYRVVDISRD